MPRRGNGNGGERGQGGGRGNGGGRGQNDRRGNDGVGDQGRAGKHDGGVEMANPTEHGRSASSPGHLKKAAGAGSARDFAPGRGGEAPGQIGRDRTEHAVETPEPDSFDREG